MQKLQHKGKFNIKENVEVYIFPVDKIKVYDDYLLLGGSPAFPTVRRNKAREIAEDYEKGANLVPDVSLEQIVDLMIGANTNSFTHCQTGSGTNVPASTDTDLQTPITPRLTITNRYRSGLAAYFDTFYSVSDGNGTWNETALFTALTSGIIGCRRKFASSFGKTTLNTALIAWTITLAAVAD